MVKLVRLTFYERSEIKRLSRTNPRFTGMAKWLHSQQPFYHLTM